MRTLKQEYFDKLENYINDYQQKQGYSPSISDMVRDLGMPQTTVYRYITHMKENGMIDIKGRGKIATREMEKTKRATIKLPVLGAVSCGIPKYAEENIEEYRFLRFLEILKMKIPRSREENGCGEYPLK